MTRQTAPERDEAVTSRQRAGYLRMIPCERGHRISFAYSYPNR